MATLSESEWRRLKLAYILGREPVEAIAKRFGTSPATIRRRAQAHVWPQRLVPSTAGAEKLALILRFYHLIDVKLEQMEDDMASVDERTPADSERETRALGTLIRNFEKVFGLEQETAADGDKRAGRSNGANTSEAEAEAIRRELAERLVRLRRANQPDSD